MFEFEKLDVYKKAKIFNADIRQFISGYTVSDLGYTTPERVHHQGVFT